MVNDFCRDPFYWSTCRKRTGQINLKRIHSCDVMYDHTHLPSVVRHTSLPVCFTKRVRVCLKRDGALFESESKCVRTFTHFYSFNGSLLLRPVLRDLANDSRR